MSEIWAPKNDKEVQTTKSGFGVKVTRPFSQKSTGHPPKSRNEEKLLLAAPKDTLKPTITQKLASLNQPTDEKNQQESESSVDDPNWTTRMSAGSKIALPDEAVTAVVPLFGILEPICSLDPKQRSKTVVCVLTSR